MRLTTITVGAVLCVFTVWGASGNHRESLRGLSGVQVRVERLSDAALEGGMDEKSLASAVEGRLRNSGIKVIPADQGSLEQGAGVLYVRVNIKPSYEAPVFASGITVALLQDVIAARDSGLRIREAKTWDAGYMRTYDQASLRQARSVVDDLVDEFIRDYREANGKR